MCEKGHMRPRFSDPVNRFKCIGLVPADKRTITKSLIAGFDSIDKGFAGRKSALFTFFFIKISSEVYFFYI